MEKYWKESARDVLNERRYLMDSVIESPVNLYNACEGVGMDTYTSSNSVNVGGIGGSGGVWAGLVGFR